MTPDLIVYPTPSCGDWVATEQAMRARGIDFAEFGLDDDEEAADRVRSPRGGRRGLPW